MEADNFKVVQMISKVKKLHARGEDVFVIQYPSEVTGEVLRAYYKMVQNWIKGTKKNIHVLWLPKSFRVRFFSGKK